MTALRARIAPALAFLLVALTAAAAGVELEPTANALVAEYEALHARIDACPDGDCDDRTDIEADLVALDQDLADLEADRAAIQDCQDCATLDALIDDAVALSVDAGEISGEWDHEH